MSGGSTHHDTLPPGTRLREFELVNVLGRGGFGVTYRGWDTIKTHRGGHQGIHAAGLCGARAERRRLSEA